MSDTTRCPTCGGRLCTDAFHAAPAIADEVDRLAKVETAARNLCAVIIRLQAALDRGEPR